MGIVVRTMPMDKDRFDWEGIFWGDGNVLCFNWDASYMDVYTYKNLSNCIFKICGFHYA